MKGIIKTKTDKNFGFITAEGAEKDLFFHHTALVVADGETTLEKFAKLNEGDKVEFDEQADPKDQSRFRAVNVKLA